jgi:predicted metal-dependent phosphoesterase TrpH
MPRLRFDLQSHSTHSDGVLEPAEVVRRAAAAGIEVLALSDHDTVDGVEEALTAASEAGIVLVPAAEISAVDPPYEDLHLLGYGVDHRDPALLAKLEDYRADRLTRADRMAAALRDLGWGMDEALLDVRRAAGKPVGRPHLADAVVADPANAARLADEGLATATDLLVAYLIPGTPAYRGRERPTVAEAIATIHAAGGLAVWAHPFWDIEDADEVVAALDRFCGYGLDGVEAFYVTHTEEQVRLLHDHCAQRGLQTTGSSDFHGPDHPRFATFGAHEAYDLTPTFRFGDAEG